jgi:hypothetical protein
MKLQVTYCTTKTLKQLTITAIMLAFTASAMAATNGYYALPTQTPPYGNFFYADSHPDYVLQNARTRQTAIWYLNNNAYIGSAYGPTLFWAGWSLEGVAFDRYGQAEYYLSNPVTNQTEHWSWSESEPEWVVSIGGPTVPNGWKLVAIADFNWDGFPDYVLLNATTHQTAIWDPTYNDLYIRVGPTLPSGWVLVGVSDFNRDGHRDYALFNPTTRRTAIWYLSGVRVIGAAWQLILPSGWALVATADFNGDGKADYVLYHGATRKTAIWYLNNNAYTGFAYGPTIPVGWSLVALTHPNRD